MTRQRAWQIAQKEAGCCIICGARVKERNKAGRKLTRCERHRKVSPEKLLAKRIERTELKLSRLRKLQSVNA